MACPVIKDAQIFIAGRFPDDIERCEENVIMQIREWKELRK
jgi:hypothetical protein